MLVNHTKSPSLSRTLEYILKPGSRIIGGNVVGQTLQDLTHEFNRVAKLRPEIKQPAYHASISAAPDEDQSDQQFSKIGDDFIKGMNFTKNQYLIVRHTDQDHEHIHILGNRIGWDGSLVSDSWDYRRAEKVMQELREKYDLPPLTPSWKKAEYAPSFAERYRQKQEQKEFDEGLRSTPPTPSVRQRLLTEIQASAADQPSVPKLVERLQQSGIEVKLYLDRAQKGISFQLDDVKFAGNSLGRGYSFSGLQNYFNVSYDSERDDATLHHLMTSPADPQRRPGLELELDEDQTAPLSRKTEETWQAVQRQIEPYQFDPHLIHHLYQAEVLLLDKKKRLAFGERTLDDQETGTLSLDADGTFERNFTSAERQPGSFWLARGDTINQAVIVNTPLEAIAAYSLDEANPCAKNTLYLAADCLEQLPDRLDELNQVYYSSQCHPSLKAHLESSTVNSQEVTPHHPQGWIEDWRTQQTQRLQRALQNPRQPQEIELEL